MNRGGAYLLTLSVRPSKDALGFTVLLIVWWDLSRGCLAIDSLLWLILALGRSLLCNQVAIYTLIYVVRSYYWL